MCVCVRDTVIYFYEASEKAGRLAVVNREVPVRG